MLKIYKKKNGGQWANFFKAIKWIKNQRIPKILQKSKNMTSELPKEIIHMCLTVFIQYYKYSIALFTDTGFII